MDSRLGLAKRLLLESGRAAFRTQVLEHRLSQLFWECTLRCNLNCRHCGSDCRKTAGLEDPPMSDLLGVLDSSPAGFDRGNCVVITTGGEPLVRKDIIEVGAQIRQRGYLWGMVTNGMLLTQDKVRELVDTGLDTVAMSFDGFEPEHNWMRGSDQSFKRADAALDWFNEHPGLTWDVITCVNRRNFNYLNEFYSELVTLYWVWKNGVKSNRVGFCHYRRMFREVLDVGEGTCQALAINHNCHVFLHYKTWHNYTISGIVVPYSLQ